MRSSSIQWRSRPSAVACMATPSLMQLRCSMLVSIGLPQACAPSFSMLVGATIHRPAAFQAIKDPITPKLHHVLLCLPVPDNLVIVVSLVFSCARPSTGGQCIPSLPSRDAVMGIFLACRWPWTHAEKQQEVWRRLPSSSSAQTHSASGKRQRRPCSCSQHDATQ